MNAIRLVVNNAARSLAGMFPGYFEASKHNHYRDFGLPTAVTFDLAYNAFRRNGLGAAAVNKTIGKTWQDNPFLQEFQRDGTKKGDQAETQVEADIRQRFDDLRLWQRMAEADRRSMVGAYAGVIVRFADGQRLDQPVTRVPGGLLGLVEIIPAWEGQLTASQWNTDETSEGYGQPTLYQFNEAAVGTSSQPRQFNVHPDRVIIWSSDGTLNSTSALEPGYNDLMAAEKIIGAGGEGFWKNAKAGLGLEVEPTAQIDQMAKTMGVEVGDVVDKMNEQVEGFNQGFDKSLMLQGIKAKVLGVTLPSPEHFFAIAVQSFAASMTIPMKILVGSQTGERASTEDNDEWSRTNMARRRNQVVPTVMAFVRLLERVGILPAKDWHLDWADLTESTMGEKIDRATKMADVNQKMPNETVFTGDDIRNVVGMEPLSDDEKFGDEDDDSGALGDPLAEPDPAEEPADAA